ncbi:Lanosterol 14-alpha-demethylase [Coccidioides posadasii str. Silveira]|uniref:sterol 14alpha-demethylase n=1 Tax=Coccidioides posadasii (strain RMSCC 757 / Silveira) TaxID=443226 RepID=E9DIY7_COCPS|nr:cytochrome P450 51 [Coccidioides posadasii str. Silveira]QVM10822.1 Lanosterol 14-alpha-demethylase [Coccidioides posadasii str. Silveira]
MESLPFPSPTVQLLPTVVIIGVLSIFIGNLLRQFAPRRGAKPPVVFHWVPFIGSAISYGLDPYRFFTSCREKYGDIFTFVLLGRKVTVYLGVKGNEFILNGKLQDVNAEEVYSPLTTPVFGSGVIYDCPNQKLMEQKKFIKFGLSSEALASYVPLIQHEVEQYIASSPHFKGESGTMNVAQVMAEITILTAARTLQGEEVRSKLDSSFANYYHDLDSGFTPINFLLPWAPLSHNRKRDAAHKKMRDVYMDIIKKRRISRQERGHDMLWNLMDNCVYKDGTALPDKEIAHLMITLLMAGQHTSSAISAWAILQLAAHPEVMEGLYQEQVQVFGPSKSITLGDIDRLSFSQMVIKETLRLHAPIHSIMRKAKNTMAVPGTNLVIPESHILLSAPGFTARSEDHFKDAAKWNPHRWFSVIEPSEADEKIDYGYGVTIKGTKSPYLPFGAGRHRCIGEKFAYVNLGVILAVMVRHFKLRNPDNRVGVPATDYTSLLSRPMEPSSVHWEKRNFILE